MERRRSYGSAVSHSHSAATAVCGGEAFENSESSRQRRSRHYSLIIIYFGFVVLRMQESIYYISIWNYILYIDPGTETHFLGIIYLASSLTSVVASLLLGKLSNIISNTKLPIMAGVALITIGNLVMAFAHAFPGGRKWVVFAAKVVISIGMGVQGNMTAYLAMGSKLTERNRIMSYRAAMISFATVIGGCLQMAFSVVGYPGVVWGPLRLDMYTLPAFTCTILGVILVVMIKLFFVESWVSVYKGTAARSISETGGHRQHDGKAEIAGTSLEEHEHLLMDSKLHVVDNSSAEDILTPMDRVAAFVTIFDRFIYAFCGYAFRAIAPPLTMLMFNWTPKQVVFYNSLASMVSYIGRSLMELSVPFMLKFVKERLMMVISSILLTIFFLISFAWPSLPPLLAHSETATLLNYTYSTQIPQISHAHQAIYGRKNDIVHNGANSNSTAKVNSNYYLNHAVIQNDLTVNCTRDWCKDITKISIFQFGAGYLVLQGLGMPIGILAAGTLVTKIPGPRKQGTIQGVYHAAGQLAASLAPPLATAVFQYYGPRPVWGAGFAVLLVAFTITAGSFRRLLPWVHYEYVSVGSNAHADNEENEDR